MLTDKELGLIIHLLRREARLLGYGRIYHDGNRKSWPSRLKGMETIVKKLVTQRRAQLNEPSKPESGNESSSLSGLPESN